MEQYLCWGEHQEDLTTVAKALFEHQSVVVLEIAGGSSPPRPRVFATCSQGHENIFAHGIVVGAPPTPADKMWIDALDVLTPASGLRVIETHAQFIFSAVTLFGTLLTGFGIVSDVKVPVNRIPLVTIPVSFLALSLVATVLAMVPAVARLHTFDLQAVEKYVNARLQSKGRLIRFAGVCLGLSLLSVIPVYSVLVSPDRDVSVRPTFRFVRQAEKSTLTIDVHVLGLDSAATGKVHLEAKSKDSRTTVLEQDLLAGADGSFQSTVEIPVAREIEHFDVTTTIEQLGGSRRYIARFRPPPQSSPEAPGNRRNSKTSE